MVIGHGARSAGLRKEWRDGSRAAAEVRMVLGVARLGEADLKGWWSCHGLDRAGSFVLGRAFPRTAGPAGLELDMLSARRRHDDALARRSNALHLFSDGLPFRRWASAWLSEQKCDGNAWEILDLPESASQIITGAIERSVRWAVQQGR